MGTNTTVTGMYNPAPSQGNSIINHEINASFGLAPEVMGMDFGLQYFSSLGCEAGTTVQTPFGGPEPEYNGVMLSSSNKNGPSAGCPMSPAPIFSPATYPAVSLGGGLHKNTSQTESNSPSSTNSE